MKIFLLNLFYNEHLLHLLCSCINPILGKTLFPDIWAKMFSANQISGFSNQPYLQNKSMNFCMLIRIHINWKVIKIFLVGCGQRWVWPVLSQNTEIDCISRMHWWNELILYAGSNSGKLKVISMIFRWPWSKMGMSI